MSHLTPHGMTARGTAPDGLVVCSNRHWLISDFETGAAGRYPVYGDLGLDIPDIARSDAQLAWWAPAEHAARLLRAGVTLTLSAPGPSWLAQIPTELLGRTIWAGTLRAAQTADLPSMGYAKPAEAKVADLAAAWWNIHDFLLSARAAGLDDDSWIQISDTRLDIIEEHRCYIVGGEVLTTSPYLTGDHTYELGWETDNRFQHTAARRFAADAVAHIGPAHMPDSYTLDVAGLADGRWVIIEANPSWCSGPYGCDMTLVADAVAASSLAITHHAWQPDSYLTAYANKATLLETWHERLARQLAAG